MTTSNRLTASAARNILAAATLLSTGESNTLPGPVRAATTATQNVEAGNGDAGGGGTSRTAVLVVLLDDDAVFSNAGERDVLIGYARDRAFGAINGLNANAYYAS